MTRATLYRFLAADLCDEADDDEPTAPGNQAWYPCECLRRCHECGTCQVCNGTGARHTLVPKSGERKRVIP